MDEYQPFEPKWYWDLKKSREEFENVENIIESAKFRYDRDFNIPKWLVGTGITTFLSAAYKLSDTLPVLWKTIAIIMLTMSAIEFFIALLMICSINKRQEIAMSYLYREKDKQDKLNKNNSH
jgi:hypothetical protein